MSEWNADPPTGCHQRRRVLAAECRYVPINRFEYLINVLAAGNISLIVPSHGPFVGDVRVTVSGTALGNGSDIIAYVS